MNKFLINIGIFLIIAFTLVSCEDTNGDNFRADTESGYVQHVNDSFFGFTGEVGMDEIKIPVSLHTNVNKTGLQVNYVIEDVVGNSSDVISGYSGVVSFEKGQLISNIVLPVSGNIPAGGIQFDVKLTSTSRGNVTVGVSESNTTPIIRRVCVNPYPAGTYSADVYFMENETDENPVFVSSYVAELSPTEVSGIFTIDSAWGPDFVPFLTGNPANSTFDYPATITFGEEGLLVDGTESYGTAENEGTSDCGGGYSYILTQELFPTAPGIRAKVILTPLN